MAIASTSNPMTEPSHQSFHSSPLLTPKQQQQQQQQQSVPELSSGSSETSSRPIADTPPDTNYQSDSSVHPRREIETHSPAYLKSEEYRLLFRLPQDEMLVQDFNCALQDSILFQGHMYLFIHHICFYSNIFGFETKKTIPFKELKYVRKAKTAAIFPNAIEIVAADKKYFFASFLSRDEAYRLIVDGWSQQCSGTDVLIDHQDLKSEIRSEDSMHVLLENFKGSEQRTIEPHSIIRDEDGDRLEDCNLLSNGDGNITILSTLEALENGAGDAELIVKDEQVSTRKSLSWKVEDADAPKVPDVYTKVAESKFPVQVEDFFNLFCSDEAINFIDSFHRKCGDKELRCTSWSKHKEHGYTREVSFQHPIKIYLGAKYGTCHEVQRFRVYSNSHLVIETSQEVSDVPYGDYFSVQGLWVVAKDGNETSNSCILRVYVNVAFSKKTMWKGKIESSTVEECREAFSVWLSNAHELLKQKNLEKSEGEALASDTSPSNAQCGELGSDEGSLIRSHDASVAHNQIPDTKHIGPPFESSQRQGFIAPSFGTRFFRESLARFSVYLKSQNHLTLFLAISFILILFMQLSIIVLLSRGPQVHVISQIDHMNMIGSRENNLVEAGAWLEKRFNYLKDEMHMVESRLESMRQEYALLKENFKGLEQLRKA